MRNSIDAAAERLPCRHLVVAGLPGSGKATLRRWLAARLAYRYLPIYPVSEESFLIPWGQKSALDFHTPYARKQIREGNLLRSPRYWTEYLERLKFFFDQLNDMPFQIHTVSTGTYLSRSLRQRVVDLGRTDRGPSDVYLVWLKVSPDVAKRRLAKRLEENSSEAFFQPEWINEYLTLTEFPKPTDGQTSTVRLQHTDEENVFILDADRTAVGVKGNAICDPQFGIPGINAYRRA